MEAFDASGSPVHRAKRLSKRRASRSSRSCVRAEGAHRIRPWRHDPGVPAAADSTRRLTRLPTPATAFSGAPRSADPFRGGAARILRASLTRATDNRLKALFTNGEVRYGEAVSR